MHNLILCGFKGCGKSYFGKLLANKMEKPFIDSDRVVETLYASHHALSLSCADIAKKEGMDFFRDLEHAAVLTLENEKGAIIALGGGTPLFSRNLKFLKALGSIVYLRIGREVLTTRVTISHALYEERLPLYKSIANIVVDLEGKGDDEVLRELEEICHGK